MTLPIPSNASVSENDILETEADQIQLQIQAAQDEIAALIHRKSTLSAHFLINPPNVLQSLLQSSTDNGELGFTEEVLINLRDKYKAQRTISLRGVHRLCTSATTFETRDPDPAAVDGGYVFGVRIEIFSTQTREFLTPHYLLLNRPWRQSMGRDDLRLHRHTFPVFIPVKEICKRWLPEPIAEDLSSRAQQQQDIQSLTADLRRRILSYVRREDAIASMGNKNADFVSRITLPGAENLEAKIYLKNSSTANIRLDAKGRIQKVSARDDMGRRLHSLERQLQKMSRIEDVDLSGG